MYELLHRMINSRYSVAAWEWVLLTFFMGLIVTGYSYVNPEPIMGAVDGLPFEGKVWGPLITLTSGAMLFGMWKNLYHVIRHSSFVTFLLMIFLDISWWISSDSGYISVLAFCSWITLFWLYKYLASFARERDQV